MIRLLFCLIVAALFSASCVLDSEKKKPDHVSLQLDPVLLGLTRVEIFRLDGQGKAIAPALFNDSLRALADVANLDARGYGGGAAVFSVKGYKGAEMVYEIKVSTNGKTATVQAIKLIPLHSVTLKIAEAEDRDKDGFMSGYYLAIDVNTNLDDDSIVLRYFWKKDGATAWESRGSTGRFGITRLSALDAVLESMEGGMQANGAIKVEAYDEDNLMVAEKTLNVREETADQDDPGFHFLLINQTGTFLEARLTVSGKDTTGNLAPKDTLLVERTFRPEQISYYAVAEGNVVIWEDTVAMIDLATYKTALTLENNTEDFFILTVANNSAMKVDRVVVNQGLPSESALKGPIPGDGVSYNAGAHNYSSNATVTLFNDSTGKVATIYPLQFDISTTYGYRYAAVVLSNSNWADPSLNLFGKNWKLIGSAIEPGKLDTATGIVFTDVYARMQGCARDGFMTFNANGTFTDNEGPTKCDNANPQSFKGTWSLNTARTLLTMKWETDTAPMVFTVGAMTPTTLKLSNDKDTWDDGKVHNLIMTFSAL